LGRRVGQQPENSPSHAVAFPSGGDEDYIASGRADLAIILFFALLSAEDLELYDDEELPLFEPALQKLGTSQHDEMYGFVPAVALCGAVKLANLQKVKAIEHLIILAQFAELRVVVPPQD
jgi:hypothetical protein